MIFELLTVDKSVRKMKLNFETGHPFKPLYGVTNDRTFELYMHHAWQDSTKNSLLVTLGEESVRHDQCSNNAKKEAQNLSESDILGIDSIHKVQNVVNSSNGAEDHILPEFFGSKDVNEMPIKIPSLAHIQFVAPTPTPSFVHVVTNATEGSERGTGVEDVCTTPVEPYQNRPPIPISVVEADAEGSGCGD